MIRTGELTKRFENYTALDAFTTEIPEGSIYGLVGSNGSGKSTLLRLVAGIYRPDGGWVTVDEIPPFEKVRIKDKIVLVADDLYFLPQCTMDEMAGFYKGLYSGFDLEVYRKMASRFPIPANKKINTFSKGMKRQAALILALSCRPGYLLLDEAFDGLDPVIRGALRKILADQIAERGMTVIISSHNLRELEDLCDRMGLLHQGKILMEREIDEATLGFCKVQAAFTTPPDPAWFKENLNILQMEQTGSVISLVARGNRPEVLARLQELTPAFCEGVSLTLEEVFIHEMEAIGYDYNNILF